jgi:hypothetical protein
MINKKINVQSGKKFPNYKDWNEEDKKQLAQFCTLADKYSYRLL